MQALPRSNINSKEAGSHYSCSMAVRMVMCHSLQLKFNREEIDCFCCFFFNFLSGVLSVFVF